jgi:Cas7 group CRISPR-associated protein Csh2
MVDVNLMKKRVSGFIVLEICKANPNGSPDDNNRPRTFDRDGREYGFMTPMCLKRKIRDFFVDHRSICFQEFCATMGLNPERFWIYESKERSFVGKSAPEAAKAARELAQNHPDEFLNMFIDMRLFGGMLLEQDSSKEKKKGEKNDKFVKTGPITIAPAVSVSPIDIVEVTVAKTAINDESEKANEQTLGPAAFKMIPHALYVCEFSINPHLAHHTLMSVEDVEAFQAMLPYMFSVDESVARPGGSIRPIHIFWKEHENSLGSFNEFEFWNSLRPTAKVANPTCLADYNIPDGKEQGIKDLMATSIVVPKKAG